MIFVLQIDYFHIQIDNTQPMQKILGGKLQTHLINSTSVSDKECSTFLVSWLNLLFISSNFLYSSSLLSSNFNAVPEALILIPDIQKFWNCFIQNSRINHNKKEPYEQLREIKNHTGYHANKLSWFSQEDRLKPVLPKSSYS